MDYIYIYIYNALTLLKHIIYNYGAVLIKYAQMCTAHNKLF